MQKTQHFNLNQWDLDDLVRMQDFNADNLALDNALNSLSGQVTGLGSQVSGLDSQVSGLGSQVSGLGSQISGLPSADDLSSIQSALQATQSRLSGLEGSMLQYVPESSPSFTYQNGRYIMNFFGKGLDNYALICMNISILGGNTELFHLKPRYASSTGGACMITSYGDRFYTGAISLHPQMSTTTVLLFPLGGKSSGTIIGTVFFGSNIVGVGTTGTQMNGLSGFELAPASGSANGYDTINVELSGIK